MIMPLKFSHSYPYAYIVYSMTSVSNLGIINILQIVSMSIWGGVHKYILHILYGVYETWGPPANTYKLNIIVRGFYYYNNITSRARWPVIITATCRYFSKPSRKRRSTITYTISLKFSDLNKKKSQKSIQK